MQVLEDVCPPFPSYHYHLNYRSRWHASLAFSLVLDALRIRDDNRARCCGRGRFWPKADMEEVT